MMILPAWYTASSLISIIFCLSLFQDCGCLRDVSLQIRPPIVQRGQKATLMCLYTLDDGAPLYSVKWYRGRHEFYRFSPTESPTNKIFPYDGINVDLSSSNASMVVLQLVGFNLSGNLSCEVTADAPSFATTVVSRQMVVVELPDGDPVIRTEHTRYFPGDLLVANCSCSPSKPGATITLYLNNISVAEEEGEAFLDEGDDLVENVLSLIIRLDASHFQKGAFVLRCEVVVTPLYQRTTQLRLSNSPFHPVPERVMLGGGRSSLLNGGHFSEFYLMLVAVTWLALTLR